MKKMEDVVMDSTREETKVVTRPEREVGKETEVPCSAQIS
jgi:hypothetical protein